MLAVSHAILNIMNINEESYHDLLKTGFDDIDRIITGLYPGELTIIGSRPEISKLALLTGITRHVAVMQKRKVAFFCFDITREQLALRMLREECRKWMGLDKKTQDGWTKLTHAAGCLKDSSMFIDDTDSLTVSEMLERAQILKAREGLDIVVIASVGLLACGRYAYMQSEESGRAAKALKNAAVKLHVPILVSCTVRTPVGDKPAISDIGSIEPYADTVIFVHRDDISLSFSTEPITEIPSEIIIAKNKRMRLGSTVLDYIWGADGTSAYEDRVLAQA